MTPELLDKPVSQIGDPEIFAFRNARAREGKTVWETIAGQRVKRRVPARPSTINRDLRTSGAALKKARPEYRFPGAARVNGKDVVFSSGLAMRQMIDVAGLPSVAVPVGFGGAGLPLSVQIVGPAWGEAKVLRIAHAYEVATPELRCNRPTAIA